MLRDPDGARRIGKLRAPAYGLGDAPAFFRWTLSRYLVRSDNSMAHLGLKFQASPFRPYSYFSFRESGGFPAISRIFVRAAVRSIVLGLWSCENTHLRTWELKCPGLTIPRPCRPRRTCVRRCDPFRPHRLYGWLATAPCRLRRLWYPNANLGNFAGRRRTRDRI